MDPIISFHKLIPCNLVGYITLSNNLRQPIYEKYVKKSLQSLFIIISGTTDHYSLTNPDFEAYDKSLSSLSHYYIYYPTSLNGVTTVATQCKPVYPQNINLLHYLTP